MDKYYKIIYVKTRLEEEKVKRYIENIRNWTWGQSPVVRWLLIESSEVRNLLSHIDLKPDFIIFEWFPNDQRAALDAIKVIAESGLKVPILVIVGQEGQLEMVKLNIADIVKDDDAGKRYHIKLVAELNDQKTLFEELGIDLPSVDLHLINDDKDIAMQSFIGLNGKDKLCLTIQKFFPFAGKAFIFTVGGGWSEAKLCRLQIDNEPGNEYFLKLFSDQETYRQELNQHLKAKVWLKDSTVDLRNIPELNYKNYVSLTGTTVDLSAPASEESILAQSEAFPNNPPDPHFPVCYESASRIGRQTLLEIYRSKPESWMKNAFNRLFDVLESNQTSTSRNEPPWWTGNTEKYHCLTSKIKRNLLADLDDLKIYGPALFDDEWNHYYHSLQELIYVPYPSWLQEPRTILLGHTHGDPNPRNCLVNPSDGGWDDIKLIDCGEYNSQGRRVSDLALIERDIKFVLMNTDKDATKFFDLDTSQIETWRKAEEISIDKGLNFKLDYLSTHAPVSVRRAYMLIELVRERAKKLSDPNSDVEGTHYFAALLFWTLDVLKYKAIRRTKRLLALYSAAKILERFT